jgi:hypothetical protein
VVGNIELGVILLIGGLIIGFAGVFIFNAFSGRGGE